MNINKNTSPLTQNTKQPAAIKPTIYPGFTEISLKDDGLAQIKGATSSTKHCDLSKFTTWGGSGLSLGRLIGSTLRLPGRLIAKTGVGIEAAGAKISNTAGRFVVNNTGSGIKNLGNILGAAAGMTGSLVTLAERGVFNSLKGLAGITVGGIGLTTGLLSLGKYGSSMRSTGATLIKNAFMTRGEPAQKLTQAKASEIANLITLQRAVGSGKDNVLPKGFTALKKAEIPAKFQRYYKEASTEKEKTLLMTGKLTSALRVSISRGPNNEIYVAFKGTDGKPGTLTSDVLGVLGIADSSFRMARDLVGDLAKMHGAENIHVQGHSLGGALAQFAGIKAGVASVTCFNSLGLPGVLCDKLVDLNEIGKGKLKHATNVEHFNSSADKLSQGIQSLHLPFGLSQLGTRYVVEGGRHSFPGLQDAINTLARSEASHASLQETTSLLSDGIKSDSVE
jgi:hypothetical protein